MKLLPMLCALYQEQQSWSENECIDEIVHLLHILYAFWPQLEVIIIYYFYNFVSLFVDMLPYYCCWFWWLYT